jgi:hypothetical protein
MSRRVATYSRQLAVLSRKNFLLKKRQTCCVSGCCAELRLGTWSPTCCCFCCPFVVLLWELLLPFLVLCLLAYLRTLFKDAFVPEGWTTVESSEFSNEASDAVQWYHHQPQTLSAQSQFFSDLYTPPANGLVTRPMPLADFVQTINARKVSLDWTSTNDKSREAYASLAASGSGDDTIVSLTEYLAGGPGKQGVISAAYEPSEPEFGDVRQKCEADGLWYACGDPNCGLTRSCTSNPGLEACACEDTASNDWSVAGTMAFTNADFDESKGLDESEFKFAWGENSGTVASLTSWGSCAKIALAPSGVVTPLQSSPPLHPSTPSFTRPFTPSSHHPIIHPNPPRIWYQHLSHSLPLLFTPTPSRSHLRWLPHLLKCVSFRRGRPCDSATLPVVGHETCAECCRCE